MGEISVRLSDLSIFTAEDPRREDINKIISEMVSGAEKVKYSKELYYNNCITPLERTIPGKHYFLRIPERGEAITFAIQKIAKKGDTVVLCGKGHEKSMSYNGIEYPWSDKKAVEYALRGKVLKIKGL
jgi:UDP-N-acetylmuramoyl-L-alanyl-D-glutamate--2,6-diaminopimelate ligase